jgi:hypothetical protein
VISKRERSLPNERDHSSGWTNRLFGVVARIVLSSLAEDRGHSRQREVTGLQQRALARSLDKRLLLPTHIHVRQSVSGLIKIKLLIFGIKYLENLPKFGWVLTLLRPHTWNLEKLASAASKQTQQQEEHHKNKRERDREGREWQAQ